MKKLILLILLLLLPANLPAQEITGLAGWTIYLDPGHSRNENMGIYNYAEARKVLRVGLALRQLLLDRTDIEDVYISRENDQVSVGLSDRSDEANQLGADWYHSIHSNAGSATANNILLLWGQYSNGNEKVPNGGKAMSDIMVQKMSAGYRIPSIGSRGDCSFYGGCNGGPYLSVNRRTTMPSELSEGGFHTNPTQNTRNMNADWKRLEAYTLFWSILQLHGIEIPRVGIVTGYVTDKETGAPLNGVQIQLGDSVVVTDTFDSLFKNYSTNPDLLHNGFYFFEDLPDTNFTLRVQKDGYYPDSMQVTLQNDFFTFVDVEMLSSTPPQIISTHPAEADTGVSILALIQLNFNRPMNRRTVENALQIQPETGREYIWQNGDKRLIIKPQSLQSRTEYHIIIDTTAHDNRGVSIDGDGDGIAGDPFELIFTTGIDEHPPSITSVYPLNGAQRVELNPLVNITFNELLNSATQDAGFFTVFKNTSGELVPGEWRFFNVDGRTSVNFFPAVQLEPSTLYKSRIDRGVSDLVGNATHIIRNFSFKTGDSYFNSTSIDDFEAGILDNWWPPQNSGSTMGIIDDSTTRSLERGNVNLLTGSRNAMKISYGWDNSVGSHLIRVYLSTGVPRALEFDDNQILQVYVFGDGSGNGFRFAIDDNIKGASSGHEVSPWYTIDWRGWKLISWDLKNDGVGNWIGDGKLDGVLRFDSFQLTKFTDAKDFGAIIVDDLRLANRLPLSIDNAEIGLPQSAILLQNYPNPFNPETTISFTLPAAQSTVLLIIYDITGKEIRRLAQGNFAAGSHKIVWNGKNQAGRQAPSGVYFYVLKAGKFSTARRMLLVR